MCGVEWTLTLCRASGLHRRRAAEVREVTAVLTSLLPLVTVGCQGDRVGEEALAVQVRVCAN